MCHCGPKTARLEAPRTGHGGDASRTQRERGQLPLGAQAPRAARAKAATAAAPPLGVLLRRALSRLAVPVCCAAAALR